MTVSVWGNESGSRTVDSIDRDIMQMSLTGLKRAVITLVAVEASAATIVQTRRVDGAVRSRSLAVELDVHYSAQH